MNRTEHLQWCKDRALEYLEPGANYSPQEAIASMMSDLGKHPETTSAAESCAMLGMFALTSGDPQEARRFIEGFN